MVKCCLRRLFMKSLKIDHRIKMTKMMIRNAFTELIYLKPIQEISVKELCEKGGINRSTFYKHYSDIYALSNEIEEAMFADFEAAVAKVLDSRASYETGDIISCIFHYLKENADMCELALGEHANKALTNRIVKYGRVRTMELVKRRNINVNPAHVEYLYSFVSSGFVGIILKWYKDKMVFPIEEITKITEHLITNGVEHLAVR